ncbi:hypothetical protein A3K93_06240 [Acinetobacter sp. NCu2D-2]|uniref:A1S_1983 family putative colistin resistance protein n=1 Tax=Acinetobacter sp. NCu2D-2 TaxID=1608473 RepID=UPI0007CDC2B7|nr:hypothetical protein [Acinetobacter sp. NCu2D-2]ANF81829.1 hypothetical protein A3K93_06240 [Acinetobacter sp. NCu2D-2]
MWLKTDLNRVKISGLLLSTGLFMASPSFASDPFCSNSNQSSLCSASLKEARQKLTEQFFTAYLVTDAPVKLLQDTQTLWQHRLQQCKTIQCFQQQFDTRLDELNLFISLNQTLTQHFLKYENGSVARPAVHLKIHQLSKDRIKIEGLAYRSPKNRPETQVVPFLAYTTPDQKAEIINNENDCKYQFSYEKAILKVLSQQTNCERFNGIYRLYD